MITPIQDTLFTTPPRTAPPSNVLSWGLGVDSSAILVRWLDDPSTRDFELDDLVVVVSHTGDEYHSTLRDAEQVVLPLLARHRVRLVEVARTRRNTTAAGEGVGVLSDTTAPVRLHADQGYALSDELLSAATVPQLGSRRCSLRAKGAVLDPVIANLTGGQPYRHYLGFETGELRRAERDAGYNTDLRTGTYPLLSWKWSRQDALDYLQRTTGRAFYKSACTYCPFQFSSKTGIAAALQRFREEPRAAAHALYLEHIAACFNPRQGLLAQGRLRDAVEAAGLHEVLDLYARHLADQEHGLYEVRRVATPRRAATPAIARSVRRLYRGSATQLHARLAAMEGPLETTSDGITRSWRHHRGADAPWLEHFFVVAPTVGVDDKQRPGFEAAFSAVSGATPTLV